MIGSHPELPAGAARPTVRRLDSHDQQWSSSRLHHFHRSLARWTLLAILQSGQSPFFWGEEAIGSGVSTSAGLHAQSPNHQHFCHQCSPWAELQDTNLQIDKEGEHTNTLSKSQPILHGIIIIKMINIFVSTVRSNHHPGYLLSLLKEFRLWLCIGIELGWVGVCVPACHKPPFSGRPALSEAFICSCLASLLSSSTSTLHSRRQPHLALDWNCAARMSALQPLVLLDPW